MNTPKPPKGRRWVRETEMLLATDRYHNPFFDMDEGRRTVRAGEICLYRFNYSRGISHRKKTRKQLK